MSKKARANVRIIAGRYRGRRIPVPAQGVRPTGDRVRETLFNWLMPVIVGSRCLDMYAGTGVLGIEALSRGAASVVLVEKDRAAVEALKRTLAELGVDNAQVLQASAEQLNYSQLGPFQLVFIDPPFGARDPAALCTLLEQSGCLAAKALVYLEMPHSSPLPAPGGCWHEWRHATAGQVRFALLQYCP